MLASPSAAAQTTVLKPVGTATKLKPPHGIKAECQHVGCLSAFAIASISRNQPFFSIAGLRRHTACIKTACGGGKRSLAVIPEGCHKICAESLHDVRHVHNSGIMCKESKLSGVWAVENCAGAGLAILHPWTENWSGPIHSILIKVSSGAPLDCSAHRIIRVTPLHGAPGQENRSLQETSPPDQVSNPGSFSRYYKIIWLLTLYWW